MLRKVELVLLLLLFTAFGCFKAMGQSKAIVAASADSMYNWEKERTSLLDSKDMVLLYGGGSHRNYVWDDVRITPYVTYVDQAGNESWMFDNFLFLEIKDGDKVAYATGYKNPATGVLLPPANQADWKRLVDYYFQQDFALGALNKAVRNATYRIGQPTTKRKITISIPEPMKQQTNWGSVNNGVVLNFSNEADRIEACIWYINYVRLKFYEANFEHLELAGFYWLAEEASNTRSFVSTVGFYLNAFHYGFNWIPYFNSPGWADWKNLRFNFAYLQPNYFFKEPLIENRLEEACQVALENNMDMELEFDERILTKQNAWHYRLDNYMEAFKRYGIWESKRIAYYQGSKALYELSVSSDQADNAIYHRFCKFVVDRSASQRATVTTDWSFSNAATPSNVPTLPDTDIPLMSVASASTRNMAVGRMNGNDRVFLFTREGADKKAKVLVYQAADGSYVKALNTGNVIAATNSGNLVSIGGGGLTTDGQLLVSNIVGPKTGNDLYHFKVYKWDNESQLQPEVVISYHTGTKYPSGRFGDKLTITGSYHDGSACIYATNKIVGDAPVLRWSMVPDPTQSGSFVFNQTPEELFSVLGKSIQSNVCVNASGDFYYKESERPIVKYNQLGDSIGVSLLSSVRDWGTSVQYVGKSGDDDLLAYFKYRSKPTSPVEPVQERVDLLRIPGGDLGAAQIIASTPSLGAEYNLNGWGDVVTRKVGNDVEIFVLSATNGIGKFTVKEVFTPTFLPQLMTSALKWQQLPGRILIENLQVRSISLYSITGQLLHSSHQQNFITTQSLQGVYILQVQSSAGNNYTVKLLI